MKTILSVLSLFISLTIFAQEKVNFTEEFKKTNQGKHSVEVNEVKELLLTMMAITDYGRANDDMFEQRGDYYQRILNHFNPFASEHIIKTMDSLLEQSLLNYIFLSRNAFEKLAKSGSPHLN